MFDKEANNIDAVTVSTPDHMHGTAAMWAMARGKHVYCQKPLTRTVWEASELTAGAAEVRRRDADGQPGLLERRRAPMLRDHLERRYRQRDGGPRLDQSPGTSIGRKVRMWFRRKRRFRRRSIGKRGWAAPRCVRTARPMCRTTGAASRISAAARSATWLATSSVRRTWRCAYGADQRRVRQAGGQRQIHVPARCRSSVSTSLPAARCRPSACSGMTA